MAIDSKTLTITTQKHFDGNMMAVVVATMIKMSQSQETEKEMKEIHFIW